MNTTLNIEKVALENAQRAYERAVINGDNNPDAAAEKAYRRTLSETYTHNQQKS